VRAAAGLAVALALAAAAVMASPAAAQKVSFKDPKDDDNGPGKYTYPTDPIYKPGSFDLTGFELKAHGDKVDVNVSLAAKLEDPWNTGSGFSLQMVFIFIQTRQPEKPGGEKAAPAPGSKPPPEKAGDEKPGAGNAAGGESSGAGKPAGDETAAAPTTGGEKTATAPSQAGAEKPGRAGKPAGGFTQGLPGLAIEFAAENAWDRCIILSPEPAARVRAEVEAKAPAMKDAIVIPARVKGSGRTLSATVERQALGAGDPRDWGYQVVVASSDAYPAADSLLVRKVNETESQHRFGGGSDGRCNPNVLDVLAGEGRAGPGEVAEQHRMLQYECNPDGTPKQLATLKMVHLPKPES
jgi:carbohydrate-binding DOMON domain-containing protein